jgi:hypothetical protein
MPGASTVPSRNPSGRSRDRWLGSTRPPSRVSPDDRDAGLTLWPSVDGRDNLEGMGTVLIAALGALVEVA